MEHLRDEGGLLLLPSSQLGLKPVPPSKTARGVQRPKVGGRLMFEGGGEDLSAIVARLLRNPEGVACLAEALAEPDTAVAASSLAPVVLSRPALLREHQALLVRSLTAPLGGEDRAVLQDLAVRFPIVSAMVRQEREAEAPVVPPLWQARAPRLLQRALSGSSAPSHRAVAAEMALLVVLCPDEELAKLLPVVQDHGGDVLRVERRALTLVWVVDSTESETLAQAVRSAACCALQIAARCYEARCGVSCGPVTVAHVGRDAHFELLLNGPAVLAARAEAEGADASQVRAAADSAWPLLETHFSGSPERLLERTHAVALAVPVPVATQHLEQAVFLPYQQEVPFPPSDPLVVLCVGVAAPSASVAQQQRLLEIALDQEGVHVFSLERLPSGPELRAAFNSPALAVQAAHAIVRLLDTEDLPSVVGVAMGEAYTGLVGCRQRGDFIVDGVPVERSERLMLLPSNAGVLCDDAVRKATGTGSASAVAAEPEPCRLFLGEDGHGKTTALRRLASAAQERGARVVWMRGVHEAEPGSAWSVLVQALVCPNPVAPPILAEELHLSRFPALATDDARARFAALGDAVAAALEPGTLVLVDDAHALDPVSWELLQHVVLPRASCVIAGRPTTKVPASMPIGETIELGALSADAVLELLSGRTVPEALRPQIVERSSGNCATALALCRAAQVLGEQQEEEKLPVTAADAVALRFARLSPLCQELLKAASVVGPEFTTSSVCRLADVKTTGTAVAEAIAELRGAVEAEFIRRWAGRWSWSDSVTRASVHALLLDRARHAYHRALGKHTHGPAAAEHFAEAGELLVAADIWTRTAEYHRRLELQGAAEAAAGRGLALVDQLPESATLHGERLRLRLLYVLCLLDSDTARASVAGLVDMRPEPLVELDASSQRAFLALLFRRPALFPAQAERMREEFCTAALASDNRVAHVRAQLMQAVPGAALRGNLDALAGLGEVLAAYNAETMHELMVREFGEDLVACGIAACAAAHAQQGNVDRALELFEVAAGVAKELPDEHLPSKLSSWVGVAGWALSVGLGDVAAKYWLDAMPFLVLMTDEDVPPLARLVTLLLRASEDVEDEQWTSLCDMIAPLEAEQEAWLEGQMRLELELPPSEDERRLFFGCYRGAFICRSLLHLGQPERAVRFADQVLDVKPSTALLAARAAGLAAMDKWPELVTASAEVLQRTRASGQLLVELDAAVEQFLAWERTPESMPYLGKQTMCRVHELLPLLNSTIEVPKVVDRARSL